MAIRVLIEREIEPGQEVKLLYSLTQMRSKAVQAKGYISGETLRSLDDANRFLVISTWSSTEDWKAWEKSPDRKKLHEEMRSILRSPERAVVFTNI